LIVEEVLTPQIIDQLTEAVNRVEQKERKRQKLSTDAILTKFRIVVEDDIFLELFDWPKTFPLLWDILGWKIQLYISHLITYPPELDKDKVLTGGWHQDGGRPVQEMERPQPRLSLKISYWLSDVDGSDRGAMQIIPGSHKRDALPLESDPQF
jgi:hypothetical protein